MSDVGLLAQEFLSLASHNVYYVKLCKSFIRPLLFCAPFLANAEIRDFPCETRTHPRLIRRNLEQPRPKILNFEISSP